MTPHVARSGAACIAAALVVAFAACSSQTESSPGVETAPSAAATTVYRSGVLSVLTYNVAGLPQGISGSNPREYMPLIGPRLDDYDLVVTQEDFATPDPNPLPSGFFHEVLVRTTHHRFKPEPMVPPVGSNEARPTAIASDGLNMYSDFEVGPVHRQMWKTCFGGADTSDGGSGDCLSMKGFSVAAVTLANGVMVDVYDLHGEAGSTPADVAASKSDYRELAGYVNRHSQGHAILLGGDTNLSTDDNEVDRAVWDRFLEATGMQDICGEITCAERPGSIDKFAFRSSESITLEPLERVVETEKFLAPGAPDLNDGQLSDHEAVSSRWRWTLIA